MKRTGSQPTASPIGENAPRIDARQKVTGAAVFADDIQFGDSLLHARIKRSPHPHALIRKIDTTRARALPGVMAVVTGNAHLCTRKPGLDKALDIFCASHIGLVNWATLAALQGVASIRWASGR